LQRGDGAKAQIGNSQGAGTTDAERGPLAQEFAAATAALRALETKALEADAASRVAKEKFAASEERVRQLVAQRRDAIERDPRLVASIRELEQAKQETAKARAKAEAEARQLAEAERKAAIEERQKQELLRKQREQAKSKNNKGKGKR